MTVFRFIKQSDFLLLLQHFNVKPCRMHNSVVHIKQVSSY